MPRKRNVYQVPAEITNDPLSLFTIATRQFKKEPDQFALNGLRETVAALVGSESDELDSAKELDQALSVFKKLRTQSAAQLVLDAAERYKSVYIATTTAKFAEKFGLIRQSEQSEQSEDDQDTE